MLIMRRILLSFAALVLALTSVQASVEINETNFPDENLRNYASQFDEDGNGTLSDDELAQITEINTTAIPTLTAAGKSVKAYDLQGRQVNLKTVRKGMYVVGGKKVVR